MKAYKFKIKRPSKAIITKFEQTLDVCRELYNAGLQERRDAWKLNRISISYYDQANQLPEIKIVRDDLQLVNAQVLQNVLKRLDKTFTAFFGRIKKGQQAGYPRFKGKNRYDSFTFPQANGSVRLEGNNLYLSKIGKVKLYLSQNVLGKVKTCTIKREVSGWFIIFMVDTPNILLEKTGLQIGIDAGIENFMTLSTGEQIPNYKYFDNSHQKLRVVHRSVCRKKKGSTSRRKAIVQLKKIHQKIKNQRNDYAHKISTQIVKNYDLMAIEDLNILGLSKGVLAKQVHDAAWGNFYQKLEYKAENAGRKLIKVNPNGTSQTCICGARVEKSLSQRWHKCERCGYEKQRDIVSAQVILNRAVGQTVETLTWNDSSCVVSELRSFKEGECQIT